MASTAALAALGAVGSARVGAQHNAVGSGGGIAGGGLAKMADGEANCSIFASRRQFEGQKQPEIVGQVRWVDGAWRGKRLALESVAVTDYGPIAGDDKNARELRGTMRANGQGTHPFVMRVLDGGPPGEGKDTIGLRVGAAAGAWTPGTPGAATGAATDAGFSYEAEATLVAGDLELLTFGDQTGG